MKYALLVNPYAGRLSLFQKRKALAPLSSILDAPIYGLELPFDIKTAAVDLAKTSDVLVVVGGDGTFSKVLSVIPQRTVLAYIPLGTGNALRSALDYPHSLEAIAHRIKNGTTHSLDCLVVNHTYKGLLASVGIDAHAVRLSESSRLYHPSLPFHYAAAGARSLLGGYSQTSAKIRCDDQPEVSFPLFTCIVGKHAWYPYQMHVNSGAQLHDGFLHVRTVPRKRFLLSVAQALSQKGNRQGTYYQAKQVILETELPVCLQVDGTFIAEGTRFQFEVFPEYCYLRY